MDSIYDRYGDRVFWERLISDFYFATMKDNVLLDYFKDKDMMKIRRMHLCLLGAAFQRGGQHFPYSVKRVHGGLGISDDIFERYIELYGIKLRENDIDESDIETIVGIMYSFKSDIVKI